MEVLDLLVDCLLADLLAVLLVQAGVSAQADQARLHPACTACTSNPCSQPCSGPADTEVTSALLVSSLCKPRQPIRLLQRAVRKIPAKMVQYTRGTWPKPNSDEIQEFFKSWWLSNYMVPLNKTPMGMVEFISAFYDKYCTESEESSDS